MPLSQSADSGMFEGDENARFGGSYPHQKEELLRRAEKLLSVGMRNEKLKVVLFGKTGTGKSKSKEHSFGRAHPPKWL